MASTPATTTTDALAQERAILDRVLHRLVVTDDDKLSAVLDKLLPKLVLKLNDATPLRAKVIDVLSHISKRARPNASITIPCAELLAVCKDVSPTSFAFNFSITFLEMGVPRLPPAEQGAVAAQIAHGISRLPKYSPSQNILLNIMLAVLEHLPLRVAPDATGGATAAKAARAQRLTPEDSAIVTDWFLDVCLYPGVLKREGSAYHGLSAAGLARLTATEKEWPAALLTRRKLAVVRALKSDLFSPAAAVVPAVSAAACSTHHEVLKAAEDLIRSVSSSDRNGALRRDSAVASGLLNLVLGGASGSQTPTAVTVSGATRAGGAVVAAVALSPSRSPASSALAVRALAWLEAECPEGTAARIPEAVRVSFQALFAAGVSGDASTPRAPGALHHDRANAARFQAAGARLAAFVSARCNPAMLPMVGPLLLQAVQRVLTMNTSMGAAGGASGAAGDASEAPPAGATLLMQIQRAAMLEACYEAIASLAVRRPQLFSGETSVPRLLFSELSAKEPSLRVKISAALGALKGAYRGTVDTSLTPELWSLLWGAAASSEHRARLCAVEWACDLFEFSDVAARRLCVTLCDDKVTAVRSAAARGLHPPPRTSITSAADDSAATAIATATATVTISSKYPSFASFVLGALRAAGPTASTRKKTSPAPASLQELPPSALARALDFALECHKAHHRSSGSDDAHSVEAAARDGEVESEEAVAVFLALIEDTLLSAPSATDGQHSHTQMVLLHRSAAVALRKLAAGDTSTTPGMARRFSPVKGVAAKLASRRPWLQQWLGHESSTEIREAFAETTGAAAAFMDPNSELISLLRALVHKMKPCTVPGAVGFSNRAVSSAHGAACAVGAILARLATAAKTKPEAIASAAASSLSPLSSEGNPPGSGAWAALSDDALPSVLSAVAAAIGHPVSLLHIAACDAIGRVGAAGALPLRSAAAGKNLDTSQGGVAAAVATAAVVATPAASIVGAAGEDRATTVQAVFAQLWDACKLGETTDASRRAEAAAEALGRCCRGEGSVGREGIEGASIETASSRLRKTLLVLFEMAKNQKEEELQFAVGAAVADLACSGPLHVPTGKVLEDMRASAKASSRELKEEAVLGKGKAMENEGAVIDALEYVLYQVLYVLLEDHSPHVSGAAAVYLLAMVKGCRGHPVLAAYLTDVQTAFSKKLSVRSEFVQEVAGKGLALVYQAADSESKKGLVDSLVEALSTGRRHAAATSGAAAATSNAHGTTRAGSALSEAGGGAYGEMCAIANDVGRPDLIYSFLSMASHHAAWSTRRGGNFGVEAVVNNVSAEAFGEHLERIVPRLFRYRFDPSAKTRSAMDQLWRSVVGGGIGGGDFSVREKEMIHVNLSAIITELLRALGDRKWRERQSACAGLSDVLRGRGWDDIRPHLEELWIMTDRALDDIKESVAEVAVDFAKTVSNISVRLCDPHSFVPPGGGSSTEGDAEAAAVAAAARSDSAGHGPDALREEAGEARRTIGTMMEDLRTSEAEARARGEEGVGGPPGGLASGEGREDAADEVVRRALEMEQQVTMAGGVGDGRGPGDDAGVGRVLGGGRSDPTVDDILRPGRAGAERTGPPPSAAARKAAADAVAVTLPWLLRKGILSRCKASQGLSMRTLQRLVKVCEKEALIPHLAELVATLIEGLSALEPQALQYMQFHAESQLEMTQDQMERLRLSVSRAGPLQDALDQCYRHLDGAGVVEELMPRLLGLLRSGTGLATRSASAYLVLSLCERAPLEIRRAAPRLLPTLTNTALSERSSTLRRTYSSALSSVARLAPAAGVSRLASRLAQLFREADPDFDKRQRRTLALLLGDLCRRAGGQLGAATGRAEKSGGGSDAGSAGGEEGGGFASSGWCQILPIAFVARRDPEKPVADAFEEAWQEGLTQLQLGAAGQGEASRVRTAKDAVLLMLPAILTEVWLAISSVSRITKRQGCSGLKDLASTLGPALGEASSGRRLVRRVLSQAHGRTWEGKEELLEAMVSLCAAGKGSAVTVEPFLWGEHGAGGAGGGGYGGDDGGVGSCSRGVKRNWRSEPLGGEEEELGEEEEEDRGVGEGLADTEAEGQMQGVSAVVEGASDASMPTKASPGVRDGGGNGADATEAKRSVVGPAGSLEGSAAGDDEDSANGAEAAFEYEDKIGDLGNTAQGQAGAGTDSGSPAAVVGKDQQLSARSRTNAEARKDAVIETVSASLDVGDDSPVSFGDVVSLMLSQLRRKHVNFRRIAAVSLAALLDAFPECCVYDMVAPTLLELAGLDGPRSHGKEDPIMQARAVACLAAAWPRVPTTVTAAAMETEAALARREAVRNVQRAHAEELTRALSGSLQRKVWSVRVPIYHVLAAVVGRSYTLPSSTAGSGGDDQGVASSPPVLIPVLTGSLLSEVVRAVEQGAEDAKYSQVRAAAVSVVVAMTARKELRLALTPHKEGLVNAARTAARDPEPRVAVEGSKAVQNLSWWP